mmetsp:Transcript_13035/g.15563  ORF Transcript_13035/g.15563 Transcript_13035/m.15563 type:complete len:260 (-) Transcript_13035:95-874(-)
MYNSNRANNNPQHQTIMGNSVSCSEISEENQRDAYSAADEQDQTSTSLTSTYSADDQTSTSTHSPSSCSICFTDFVKGSFDPVLMPCCGMIGSSVSFCKPCLKVMCKHDSIAKCPSCRKPFFIIDDQISNNIPTQRCRMCCQLKILSGNQGLCIACEIGSANLLRYECHKCHGIQKIPHPMYRYQVKSNEYGYSSSWACHQRCHAQTHWKVLEEDLHKVPDDDAPLTWQRQEQYFETIRSLRRVEMEDHQTSSSSSTCE